MNLADMMEGLRCAAVHQTKFCEITLTQAEIAPILSEYDSLRAENERLRAEMFDTATRQALQKRGDVPWTGEREDKLSDCPHEFWEREASVEGEGYCPICMAAEIKRLMDVHKRNIAVIRKRNVYINKLEAKIEQLRAEIELVSK